MTSRVLVVAKGYPPMTGGVETYSEQVVRAYLRAGLEVTLVTHRPGVAGWGVINYDEGTVRTYSAASEGQIGFAVGIAFQSVRLRRAPRFDFVHATTWRAALLSPVIASGSPLVVTVHGKEVLSTPPGMQAVVRWVLRRAAIVVSVSGYSRGVARRVVGGQPPHGEWIVAGNGLSFPAEARRIAGDRREANAEVVVLSFARLVGRKNFAGALSALQRVSDLGSGNFRYVVAGKGPELENLRSQAGALGIRDRVTFLGFVPDETIPDLYASADIFLHPHVAADHGKDFEGFGLVIADAMSFGCAAIVGRDGGSTDFVSDGVTGRVVDGQKESEIAAALQDLIDNPSSRIRMARAGREEVLAHLSWDEHVRRVTQLVS